MADTNILVVEDQRAVAGALRMRLRGLGYDVLDIAKNGREAIEKATALKPDLILMDIRLGDGIDGIEAARRIRSNADIPVVYVTAYADRDLLDRARATGPAGFINKPFTTKDLLTTINLALHQRENNNTDPVPKAQGGREAVVTTDRDGNISFVSSGAEQITGWSRTALVGQPLASALVSLYPIDSEAASAAVAAVLEQGEERILYRRHAAADDLGDILAPLSDASGQRFGTALRFDASTVETSFADLQSLAESYRFILDAVDFGVVVVDRNLRIAAANQRARELLQSSHCLELHNGHLRTVKADHLELLSGAARAAAEPGEEEIEDGLLTLQADNNRTAIIIRRIPDSGSYTDAPLVAMLIFDPGYRAPLSPAVLRSLYSLTRSEIKMVQTMVGGASLEDVANILSISVNTARTHLKHIFHKTGAKRQSELIHILETGPASVLKPSRNSGEKNV